MNETIWQVLLFLVVVAVVIEALMILALMRQVGGLMLQVRPGRVGELDGGPAIGSHVTIPGVELVKPTLVSFVSPNCGMCEEVGKAIPVVAANYPELEVLSIVGGAVGPDRDRYLAMLGRGARTDLTQMLERWEVPGTPFVVAIDADGYVQRSGIVNTLDQLESLAETITAGATESSVPSREPAVI
jgi:hypothetical protein